MSGRVFVTGSEPGVSVTLLPSQGSSVRLLGNLRSELARLSGATVRVRGVAAGKRPSKTFNVESYDVLEVDGEVPSVGTVLRAQDGALRLAGRDTVELADPPEGLRQKGGAKVWIVGRPVGEKLAVQSYGIIREAGEP